MNNQFRFYSESVALTRALLQSAWKFSICAKLYNEFSFKFQISVLFYGIRLNLVPQYSRYLLSEWQQ